MNLSKNNTADIPLVSVCMCTYNHENYLSEAIESILLQKTGFLIELLIGEDCSTDNTRKIVEKYVSAYPDLIIPVFPPKNVGSTRNLLSLIEKARGKYIAICDGDDYWTDPLKLQKETDFLEQNDEYGMVCSIAAMYIQDEMKMDGYLGDAKVESYETLIAGYDDVAAPTMFLRKDLFRNCIADSEFFITRNMFFDTAIAYWYAYHSKIKFFDNISAVYRVLANSGCHTSDPDRRLNMDLNYSYIKLYFLLKYPVLETNIESVLESYHNYNKTIVDFARFTGEVRAKQTKSYRIGALVRRPYDSIKKYIQDQKRK